MLCTRRQVSRAYTLDVFKCCIDFFAEDKLCYVIQSFDDPTKIIHVSNNEVNFQTLGDLSLCLLLVLHDASA